MLIYKALRKQTVTLHRSTLTRPT